GESAAVLDHGPRGAAREQHEKRGQEHACHRRVPSIAFRFRRDQNSCTYAPLGGSKWKRLAARPWSTLLPVKTIWLTSPCGLVRTLASTWPSLAATKSSFFTPGTGFTGVNSRPSPGGSPFGAGTAFGVNSLSSSPFPQRKLN